MKPSKTQKRLARIAEDITRLANHLGSPNCPQADQDKAKARRIDKKRRRQARKLP